MAILALQAIDQSAINLIQQVTFTPQDFPHFGRLVLIEPTMEVQRVPPN